MEKKFGGDHRSIILMIFVIIISSTLLILLTYNYIRLESDYRSLDTAFIHVSSELSEVRHSYNLLLAERDALSRKYSSLEVSYYRLKEDYAHLKTGYEDLSLKYERLNSEYSLAVEEKENIEAWYSSLRKSVNIRQGFDEDRMIFITPSDIEVNRIVWETTGGWSNPSDWNEFWMDLKKLYDWVVNNVMYSYDSPSPV
ncbi:MAG: hypothetical protein QXP99_05455, partial [Thermoproteota archaeon]